ncbi:hypothetical protein ACRB68_15180 [Actinomadura sp. RB68]|uniref:Glycosyltransferase n=1 Tax=Actinomadura macrotermitis TaxID=2585200 RepID=A0A7K0BQL9_9ACTN|nr:hypothetical protein [Actinomadura macrotermitis]
MIVYFAGTRYDGRAGTDRHVTDALSALAPVLFVDPPSSALTRLLHPEVADTRREPELRAVHANLWRLSPRVLPGAERPGMHHLTWALMRRRVRRAAAELGQAITGVIVTVPGDLLGTAPGARTLYYATDDLVAGAELLGLPRRRLEAAEADHLARADAVAVVSPVLRDRFAGLGRDAAFVPNGCAPAAFADLDAAPWPADLPRFDRPVAGFVGNINGRIDLDMLDGVADAGHPLVLVGKHQDTCDPDRFARLTGRPDVHWVGHKAFAELPSYLRVLDVGLTPYAPDGFNRASFPLKTLEYLAAGRGVVATGLPATAWLREDPEGAALIRSAADAEAFVKAAEEELATPRTPGLQDRRRRFAERHAWERRARSLIDILGVAQ